MSRKRITYRLPGRSLLAAVLILIAPQVTPAAVFTFAPNEYDNEENKVTGTNTDPIYTNNQTIGNFRDVFWWGTAYNGGIVGVGSPDFINSGKNLISNGGSPARAIVGGNYDALNFTGVRTGSGGASFLTIYDKTPGDNSTKNTFDASQPGGLKISADVLFVPGQHNASAGVVALYSEGQNGLALLARNSGGNNPDHKQLDLVFKQQGTGTLLVSQSLGAGGTHFVGSRWYNIQMELSVTGDSYTINGYFYSHVDPTNPNSALDTLITSLTFNGLLSDPGNVLDLTNPGEIGLMAMTTENFNDGVNTNQGGTGANPLVDNIGVSITNFTFNDPGPTPTPEPSTWALALVGLAVVGAALRRHRRRGV